MMTSSAGSPREAYVWIWLPGQSEPVVAGRLLADDDRLIFNYGRSYLQRDDALPISLPELPLEAGPLLPLAPLKLASCIRDAAPDAWGRRVVINRLTGLQGRSARDVELDELTFMLESGSDRIGALDFQMSATHYQPRHADNVSLEMLLESAQRVEQGLALTPELALVLQHGTAIGGARPKALIQSDRKKYVAKFSSSTDTFDVVKAEFIAMRLAQLAGMQVAEVELTEAMGKTVLLVERFDRELVNGLWMRKPLVSALTLFGLDELMAAHASYAELAEIIRHRFSDPRATLEELFARMTFNILVGNTDDHARNHAAIWNGDKLTLAPAYDICPQSRPGHEASQGMLIDGITRRSQISACIAASNLFLLHEDHALEIVLDQVKCICENWDRVCEVAQLAPVDKALMWRRQFLNVFAFESMEDSFREVMAD